MGQAGTGSSGDRSRRRHTHGGQWQSRVSPRYRRQPGRRSPDHPTQDSQWQVGDRRYLSEGSMAKLTQTSDDAARPKEVRRAAAELVAT